MDARLRKLGVKLTIGGEPSYVPLDPQGAEWNVSAIGPTKLRYAYAMADALLKDVLAKAEPFYSPGKTYPDEPNPRWAVHLLWKRDGSPLVSRNAKGAAFARKSFGKLRREFIKKLGLRDCWMRARDALASRHEVWVLPLDHDSKGWRTQKWPLGKSIELVSAEGPAGLRLPLNLLPDKALKRALTLAFKAGKLYAFFPPLLQDAFIELLQLFGGFRGVRFEGYIPNDDANTWLKLSVTPDPGVLEINLPPCATAAEYADWLRKLEHCASAAGLRSFKQVGGERLGTGGGNHILFGGPTLEENAFFTHPRWITSILRYWQHHPSLGYLFTGNYVGPSSQAPRPDESARELYDLEMAYRFLENLEAGSDHRVVISETLRHLHTDGSGNTHRSEISFDKFWNVAWPGGCRGLIEFRAIESLPRAQWMSAVGLLWRALAAMLFEKPFTKPLVDHGPALHDRFFLPSFLWEDFQIVLGDLLKSALDLDEQIFRDIWEWRFPTMLVFKNKAAQLIVRKACEGWPLLCETPLEGGNTSRFVDTSMERLEFSANAAFARAHRIFVQGRELKLEDFPNQTRGAGLRYRRTALYPSLHPGIPSAMPLFVAITRARETRTYKLAQNRRQFRPATTSAAPTCQGTLCNKLRSNLLTCDLRLG